MNSDLKKQIQSCIKESVSRSQEDPHSISGNCMYKHSFILKDGSVATGIDINPLIAKDQALNVAIEYGLKKGWIAESLEFDFSQALIHLKAGKRLGRSGWNGKGMYVVAQAQTTKTSADKIWNEHNKAHAEKLGGQIDVAPYFTLKTAQDTLAMGWIPSTGDLFANDWVIV